MPLQDLTPQLRTRLGRIERVVGWFVMLAALTLVVGFVYYAYHTASKKGWFRSKAVYFTLVQSGAGLKPGDPVYLMGFEVGRIRRVEAMPPDSMYNVYVEFEVMEPYFGYLWTEGSVARIQPADFFGKRSIEVTKGTGGLPTYVNHPIRLIPLETAQRFAKERDKKWVLAENIFLEGTNLVIRATTPLTSVNLELIASCGREKIWVMDTTEQRRRVTGVWNPSAERFELYTLTQKPYWLFAEEMPALSEEVQSAIDEAKVLLGGVIALTNQVSLLLQTATMTMSNLNETALAGTRLMSNLDLLVNYLSADGALGNWLLGSNQLSQVGVLTTNVSAAVTELGTNAHTLIMELRWLLVNLQTGVSNVNAQLQANSNFLSVVNQLIVHTDEFVQGLKRHWLFRSAFKEPKPNPPPSVTRRLTSPRERQR